MAFDPELATQAYMATLKGAARAKSDAYFEGGYWLLLWNFVVAVAVNLLLLGTGVAARLSAWARARIGWRPGQAFAFAALYIVLLNVITLPFDMYTGWWREHDFGLSNQTFGAWFSEALIGYAISMVLLGLFWMGIHSLIRRAPQGWWVAGTVVTVIGMTVMITLAPVFIEPLFNKYTPLPDSPVKQAVLSMARANGVPADNVYLVDASRQSKRISANVAGLFGTTRVALNDNLMQQDPDEIRAVMGHELGHYVLNHVWKSLGFFTLLIAASFMIMGRGLAALVAGPGRRWGLAGMDDPAILAVALMLLAGISLAATPITNTIIRTQEQEADTFGLNAARAPDGFARIAMKLSQYRKIEPTPAEEAIFFDHPSGHTRVYGAMRWKAEHLGQPDVK
jgi:STE24 endopeptidase